MQHSPQQPPLWAVRGTAPATATLGGTSGTMTSQCALHAPQQPPLWAVRRAFNQMPAGALRPQQPPLWAVRRADDQYWTACARMRPSNRHFGRYVGLGPLTPYSLGGTSGIPSQAQKPFGAVDSLILPHVRAPATATLGGTSGFDDALHNVLNAPATATLGGTSGCKMLM